MKFTNNNFVGGKAFMYLSPKDVEAIRKEHSIRFKDKECPQVIPEVIEPEPSPKKTVLPVPKKKIHSSGFLI